MIYLKGKFVQMIPLEDSSWPIGLKPTLSPVWSDLLTSCCFSTHSMFQPYFWS